MGFKIVRKGDLQKQCLAKTGARRKAGAEQVAVAGVAATAPFNAPLPEIEIEWRETGDLKLAKRRVRKVDPEHLAATMRAIAKFRFISPIVIRDGQVVDGHARLLAAQHLNVPKIPCVDVSHLSEVDARALAISLNRLAETGQWDLPELRLELAELELAGIDLTTTGFSLPELDIILLDEPGAVAGTDAEIPAPPDVAVSQPRDLWLLDHHRVLCGDSLDPSSYMAVLDATNAAAVLTDPPYNVPIAGNVSGLGKVKHGEFKMGVGEWSREEFETFLTEAMKLSAYHLIAGGVSSWFMDWRSIDLLTNAARNAGLTHLNTAVWNKGSGAMGGFLRSAHEFCGIFCKGDKPAINNVALGKHGRDRTNVWSYPGANQRGSSGQKALKDHPTPKNVEMCVDAILDVTHKGDTVLDPFLGSGTTLVAAHKSGRRCCGIELDPRYVDVIIRRWQELTGMQAIHRETGLTFREISALRSASDETSPDD